MSTAGRQGVSIPPPATLLDLKLLRSFLAVARHASFTRAAQELHLTQPAISGHVHRFERTLGVRLFEIIGHRVHLTDAARLLVEAGGPILARAQRAIEDLAAVRGLARGRVRVGASTTPGFYILPRILGRFVREHPGIDLQCTVRGTLAIEERLLANDLDCAVVGGHLASADLVRKDLAGDEIVFVAPRDHPLARTPSLGRRELADEPMIFREPGSATRERLEAWFRKGRITPRVVMELGCPEAIRHMVAAGLGLSALSVHALPHDPARAGLAVLPRVAPPLTRRLSLVYHPEKAQSPPVKALLRLLEEMVPEARAAC